MKKRIAELEAANKAFKDAAAYNESELERLRQHHSKMCDKQAGINAKLESELEACRAFFAQFIECCESIEKDYINGETTSLNVKYWWDKAKELR